MEVNLKQRPLYRRHDPASRTKYQEAKQLARTQRRVLPGTPGTLKQRTQSGKQYWVREHIRADGKKTDEYIGAVAAADKATVERLRQEIEIARALATESGHLRLFGYQRIDRKPAAVLGVLFNRGLFQAGLALVGSHAYGALLNELGILVPGYKTGDIDIARALAIAVPEDAPDLLPPGKETDELVALAELRAHAQTIPLLDFLIGEPIESVALSPNQVVPIRTPSPERFALHKLYSSQSRRTADRDKIRKDREQAAVLAGALEEDTPGRLREAFKAMPAAGKPATKRGARAVLKLLGDAHPEAREALLRITA